MIRRVVDGYASEGLFAEFHPCPDELINTVAGGYGPDDPRQDEQLAKEQENISRFGYRNWYDWCVANWGTKWDVTQEHNGDPVISDDQLSVDISFDTAWAPPIEFYEHLEGLGFAIKAYYYEPGMAFCGRYDEEGDDCYEIGANNSQWVRENVPEDINEAMGIADGMAEWEEEDTPESGSVTDEETNEENRV